MEINLKNDKENSLTSLLKFMAVAGSNMQKQRLNDSQRVIIDTVDVE
jgi:hypothetical protein